MLYRLIKKVIFIGITFLITFSQVSSSSWETIQTNSYLVNNNIKAIEKVDLLITWYYSPLPNQKKYITWSYEKEIALNGEGIWMASWKNVFMWAIAAPKKYDFWTKIYIEWYGVWVVEDRWWSLIDDTHTRIDIWMWFWDEWLERAIKWWSKKMTWYIVENTTEVNLNFWTSSLDITYIPSNLRLTPESEWDDVKKVQEIFKWLWYYNGEIDWIYNNIKGIIIKYQLQKWIILSENDEDAWYFWPKTINKLNLEKKENIITKDEKEKLLKQVSKAKMKLWEKYSINIQKILSRIKVLKNKESLDKKTKTKLEYLEMIL